MATTRVFRSGNSVAVRLPASFGAVPGTPVEVREEQGRWIVDPIPQAEQTIDWTGVWGAGAWSNSAPAATDRAMEPRVLDWGSQRLRARG